MEILLVILLTLSITISSFIIRNLLVKNERLEDFITKQSDAINKCDQRLKEIDKRVTPIVSITVNHENCENIEKIFEYLTVKCKVNSIKCTIVRDEGVYKIPGEKKEKGPHAPRAVAHSSATS